MKSVRVVHRNRGGRRSTQITVGVDGPVKILQSSYHLISLEPLVGVLEFEVDNDGFVALGMNRAVALQLREVVDMFLNEKPD